MVRKPAANKRANGEKRYRGDVVILLMLRKLMMKAVCRLKPLIFALNKLIMAYKTPVVKSDKGESHLTGPIFDDHPA